ncbi:pentatricopeptide repeat-containing protein At2g19280 isoform X1 [Cucurbita moschata]|uniref:Pentatricopeptide repeat-containing protein At2g19280 isoform X1 n=1 Tax=Cucurbita moschata TaxID=3662 RepID=A0A6J1GY27_CUCMO|nr:pentatricopeptide repeat-containing protein At2g19280 isoform X1 [Cucurbita moschata]XP_022957016.1 pentatricopeptide repeat-containing protein At2g19280 isoform X1 [Cucurbita moschata]XP_022957017.1 pentatricopeptide repeat-containing protein At2g19280 isoform X1 [Cucurbita moschata]XP_022957018.1 pentatricopeptide repeat-containing protein At2g19280 isoform X1 [Cucurbita moschata]XP_022957019.1 pentatricopeptide repeat-containing protein At2g19280 isoform X1 [Cucurbita moschata]
MKSAFSIINFCSKLNFGRKRPCRYFATANSALSSFNYADEDCFTSELPAATNSDVDSEEQNYFGNDVQVSKGLKADDDEMKLIKLILGNHGFNLGSHPKQLEIVRILDILFEESSDARLCLYYFKWSGCLSGSNRSLESICRMIHILVAGNMNHRAVDLMSHLVKNYGSKEGFSTILLKLFYETHHERKTLETTCSMLVDCYIKERMVTAALILMGQMKSFDIFPSIWVYKSVIQALLQTNQSESAWDLLEEMHRQGISLNYSINLFIYHYCAKGNLSRGWKVLLELRKFGSKPDAVDYTIVINSLCKISLLKEATALLFKMTAFGVSPDSVTMSSVIDGYCKLGKLDIACKILKYFRRPLNIFIYNSFITKLCMEGNTVKASEVFLEMSEVGLVPDCVSYTTMIGGYCKVGNINRAFSYLGKMLKSGIRPSVITYTLFIDYFCKRRDVEMAEVMLQKMIIEGLNPDVVTYNILMDGYGKKGYLHKAFELLDTMRSTNLTPDVVTYNTLINGLVTRGFLQEAKDMLDELNRRGFNIDVVTYTNIIHGYSKRGNFEEAFLVWFHMTDNCVKPDVVTCSALLSGYCRERRIDEANALFCKMLDIGLNPDLILYNTLIHGFCSVGNVDEGCNLVKKMIENSILPNNVTHRALVLGFQKRKVIDPIESATSKLQEILLAYDLQIDANGYI